MFAGGGGAKRGGSMLAWVGVLTAATLGGCIVDPNGPKRGQGGGSELPPGTEAASLLPAGVRRLTNAEYDATVRALTGTALTPSEGFAPDARQQGYTVNQAQIVDSVYAKQLLASASKVAAEVRARADELAPCADPEGMAEACARDFIEVFGGDAYRRPLEAAEIDALLAVYAVGAKGASYAEGIEQVARALLQSAGLLYATALGNAGAGGEAFVLTDHELATALALTLTGAPPDAQLLAASASLVDPAAREAQARRLLATEAGRAGMVRLIREWLEIDRITATAKDTTVYPQFADLRTAMHAETQGFVEEALDTEPTVRTLLGADWTVAEAALASLYGADGEGKVDVPQRRGILNQGAFLAVHAHASESAPVLRGVAVLRRVACMTIPSPTSLNIDVVPPVPDPTKTTRERYAVHSADPACGACHQSIDGVGFSFEGFDGMGAARSEDNGHPVDSAVELEIGSDFDGAHPDSSALAVALAESAQVRECFARQLFRAASGFSGKGVGPSETSFLADWKQSAAVEGDVIEAVVALVRSPLFSHRRAE
jgi:hypothetical protein